MPHPLSPFLVIFGTFLVALIASIYPLPVVLRWWRPEFVLLVSIYWISVFPLSISLLFLCAVGLFQDLLEFAPLGQHSLSLVIVAYICIQSYQRVRNFALWKEACWVFLLISIAQLPTNWVQGMAGRPLSGAFFFASALTSALLWPVFRIGLDRLSIHYRVNP
jgi:rod shape-determining protein MreD